MWFTNIVGFLKKTLTGSEARSIGPSEPTRTTLQNEPRGYTIAVLVARTGQLHETPLKTTWRLPTTIHHPGRRGEQPIPAGIYWKAGLVDSQGRVIYVQRW